MLRLYCLQAGHSDAPCGDPHSSALSRARSTPGIQFSFLGRAHWHAGRAEISAVNGRMLLRGLLLRVRRCPLPLAAPDTPARLRVVGGHVLEPELAEVMQVQPRASTRTSSSAPPVAAEQAEAASVSAAAQQSERFDNSRDAAAVAGIRVVGTGARRRAQRRDEHWFARVLPPVLLGVLLLAGWQLLRSTDRVAEYLLPAPLDVARALRLGFENDLFWNYGKITLQESIIGFLVGAAIALPVGYGIAHSRLLERTLQPYLAASQAVPAIAIAPLFVLWLGYGLRTVAALCALIVFFPMVMNTALGIRRLDPDVLDAARVDGAGRWALLRHFEIPLALPIVMVGVRTSLTLSITGAVVGEFVLGDQGLGGLLTIARGSFNTPLVFATIIVLMVLATTMYFLAWTVEQAIARRQRS